ncbi:Uncharacterised protein [Mycobacteroides abscessus subsp. abscessus]|nr:Uncharacterised protein [Mycobacteroides abscessus subsp. abscessus]
MIFCPLPSTASAPVFTMSATGPPPSPSPLSEIDSLSSTATTRENSTGVFVRFNPMVSLSCITAPPLYGGVSSI